MIKIILQLFLKLKNLTNWLISPISTRQLPQYPLSQLSAPIVYRLRLGNLRVNLPHTQPGRLFVRSERDKPINWLIPNPGPKGTTGTDCDWPVTAISSRLGSLVAN